MKPLITALAVWCAVATAHAQCPQSTTKKFFIPAVAAPIIAGQTVALLPAPGEPFPRVSPLRMQVSIPSRGTVLPVVDANESVIHVLIPPDVPMDRMLLRTSPSRDTVTRSIQTLISPTLTHVRRTASARTCPMPDVVRRTSRRRPTPTVVMAERSPVRTGIALTARSRVFPTVVASGPASRRWSAVSRTCTSTTVQSARPCTC
jgi:hypothetical protein